MKKLYFLFLITLFLFMSCVLHKKVVDQPKSNLVDGADKPIPWKQSYFKNISLKDSVLFFNSTEIKIEGEFFNQSFFVKDGVVNVVDSINNVSKIVSALTPGGFIDMKKSSSGEINIMLVSFSKDESTYQFTFFRNNEGFFILNGKANLIFRGHLYSITASSSTDCILLFYFNKITIKNEIKEQAPGWRQIN